MWETLNLLDVLNELEAILVQLYDTSAKARTVIASANIPASAIDLTGPMRDVWHNIVTEAVRRRQLVELLRIASAEYPARKELSRTLEFLEKVQGEFGNEEDMSDRGWGSIEENTRLRERVAVLERNLLYLQETITSLQNGQTANRSYTEKSFREVMDAQNELKQEIAALKLAFATRPIPTLDQSNVQRWVMGIGIGFALLIVMLLMLWVRLGMPN